MLFDARAKQGCTHILMFAAMAIAIAAFPGVLHSQDMFEIRVEEYEKPALGDFTFEEHLNSVGIGTKEFDGTVAPTEHQFHMSSELTAGITSHLSLGIMLLTAVVPGRGGLQYAGWRVLPHFYVPESWHLPVRVGLTAEVGFHSLLFEDNSSTLELRPIIERQIGRIQVDVNPSIERSISNVPAEKEWQFEPAVRFAYDMNPRFGLGLEYYGSTGPITQPLPLKEQVHQVYPVAILRWSRNVVWDFGVGVGLTPAGGRLVYKTRIEFSFGQRH